VHLPACLLARKGPILILYNNIGIRTPRATRDACEAHIVYCHRCARSHRVSEILIISSSSSLASLSAPDRAAPVCRCDAVTILVDLDFSRKFSSASGCSSSFSPAEMDDDDKCHRTENNNEDVQLQTTGRSLQSFPKKPEVHLSFESLTYTVNTYRKFKKGINILLYIGCSHQHYKTNIFFK